MHHVHVLVVGVTLSEPHLHVHVHVHTNVHVYSCYTALSSILYFIEVRFSLYLRMMNAIPL